MEFDEREKLKEALRLEGKKAGIIPIECPPNEEGRVKEVKRLGLLDRDLAGEQKYSALALVASYLTGSKLGFINILGSDVQQCKATFGLTSEESEFVAEVPRDISVCQYSLATPNQPLVIEDLKEDKRTKDFFKMEVYKDLRFYAGTPLVTSKGFAIGTLCVADVNPKKINEKQIECLRLLADNIVEMMESDNSTFAKQAIQVKDASSETKKIDTKYFSSASVLFADFIGFTKHAEILDPGELLETLSGFFKGFDQIVSKNSVMKIKTIGDCYMCVGGLQNNPSHAIEICRTALDMIQFVDGMNMQRKVMGKTVWNIRIGIHSGPLISGAVGNTVDVWGDTVNIASRMEESGVSGKIHISEKTANYLGGLANVVPRSSVNLKNKGIFDTFFLESLRQG